MHKSSNKYIFLGRRMKELAGQLKVSEWETLFRILLFSTSNGTVGIETENGTIEPSTIKKLSKFWGITDKTSYNHLRHFIELGLIEQKKGGKGTKIYQTTHNFYTFLEDKVTHESIPVEREKLLAIYENLKPRIYWKDATGMERKLYPFSYLLVGVLHIHRQVNILSEFHDFRMEPVESDGKVFYSLEDMKQIKPLSKMKFWSYASGKSYTMSKNQKEIFYASLGLLEEEQIMKYIEGKLKYYIFTQNFFTYS
ncbi:MULTISPECIES: hypothetical protein [Bacillus cereus group]|uniref:hypothetical protein n=1 Tax=Bacillus cereus group TaxID=86661 RepID=UPI0010157FAB|nr:MULTISPECIES: hypothetical protein [Bacillus cereus group]MCU5201649.1 hypothetical protein [Bacillus paranthracis]MCU5374675.1 hypothetical protein [Bacillus pacificus]GCF76354.1 hypothetical protein BC2926_38950 [Bacillus cereus]